MLFFQLFIGEGVEKMYKLTSRGGVFELINRESGEIVKVGSFDECYSVIENTVSKGKNNK